MCLQFIMHTYTIGLQLIIAISNNNNNNNDEYNIMRYDNSGIATIGYTWADKWTCAIVGRVEESRAACGKDLVETATRARTQMP